MKFGKTILSQLVPEWASHYVNYKHLKKVMKGLESDGESGAEDSDDEQIQLQHQHQQHQQQSVSTTGLLPPQLTKKQKKTRRLSSSGATADQPQHQQQQQQQQQQRTISKERLETVKTRFFYHLERDIEKVSAFYDEKEADFRVRLAALVNKKRALRTRSYQRRVVAVDALCEALVQFQRDLDKLLNYVTLNSTGFSKILKKWDKRSKSKMREIYLSRQIEMRPFFNKDAITQLQDNASALYAELQDLIRRGYIFPASSPSTTALTAAGLATTQESIQSQQTTAATTTATTAATANNVATTSAFGRWIPSPRGLSIAGAASDLRHAADIVSMNTNASERIADLARYGGSNGLIVDHGSDGEHGGGISGSHDSSRRLGTMDDLESRLVVLLKQPATDPSPAGEIDRIIAAMKAHSIDPVQSQQQPQQPQLALPQSVPTIPARGDIREHISRVLWRACSEVQSPTLFTTFLETVEPLIDFEHPCDDINERTFYHEAAIHGREALLSICMRHSMNIEATDYYGRTPLHYAAMHGHTGCLAQLLAAGANPRCLDNDRMTPMLYVAKRGHTECARLLLDRDPELSLASANDEEGGGADAGGFIDHSPLLLACRHGHVAMVQLLLARGTPIPLTATTSNHPLHIAAGLGHAELLLVLVQALAATGANGDIADADMGWTPLFHAAAEGHVECVRILLDAGCRADITDANGERPVYYAAEDGHVRCVQLLLSATLDPAAIQVDTSEPMEDIIPADSTLHAAALPPIDELTSTPSLDHPPMGILGTLLGPVSIDFPAPSAAAAAAGMTSVTAVSALDMPPSLGLDEGTPVVDAASSVAAATSATTATIGTTGDLDALPSLEMPPPIIPLRMYGHNYLDEEYMVQISLGHPVMLPSDGSDSIVDPEANQHEKMLPRTPAVTMLGPAPLTSVKLVITPSTSEFRVAVSGNIGDGIQGIMAGSESGGGGDGGGRILGNLGGTSSVPGNAVGDNMAGGVDGRNPNGGDRAGGAGAGGGGGGGGRFAGMIPRTVNLQLDDPSQQHDTMMFRVDKLDAFTLDFELLPHFGSKIIGRTVATPSFFGGSGLGQPGTLNAVTAQHQFGMYPHSSRNRSHGWCRCPLFDSSLKLVGELAFTFTVFRPLIGAKLEIDGRAETYWKSVSSSAPQHLQARFPAAGQSTPSQALARRQAHQTQSLQPSMLAITATSSVATRSPLAFSATDNDPMDPGRLMGLPPVSAMLFGAGSTHLHPPLGVSIAKSQRGSPRVHASLTPSASAANVAGLLASSGGDTMAHIGLASPPGAIGRVSPSVVAHSGTLPMPFASSISGTGAVSATATTNPPAMQMASSSYVTDSSLHTEYLRIVVQLTRDCVPVLYSAWHITVGLPAAPIKIGISSLTLAEFQALEYATPSHRRALASSSARFSSMSGQQPSIKSPRSPRGLHTVLSSHVASSPTASSISSESGQSRGRKRSKHMSHFSDDDAIAVDAHDGFSSDEDSGEMDQRVGSPMNDSRHRDVSYWRDHISGRHLTLAQALAELPVDVSVNIDLRYPTTSQACELWLRDTPDLNDCVDAILRTVLDDASSSAAAAAAAAAAVVSSTNPTPGNQATAKKRRGVVFSSFNPSACAALSWKQPNYPVFFCTFAGLEDLTLSDNGATAAAQGFSTSSQSQYYRSTPPPQVNEDISGLFLHRRGGICGSVKHAVRFAKRHNIFGIMCAAPPLIRVPSLIKTIKERGLLLVSFGDANRSRQLVDQQLNFGVDAFLVDGILNYHGRGGAGLDEAIL